LKGIKLLGPICKKEREGKKGSIRRKGNGRSRPPRHRWMASGLAGPTGKTYSIFWKIKGSFKIADPKIQLYREIPQVTSSAVERKNGFHFFQLPWAGCDVQTGEGSEKRYFGSVDAKGHLAVPKLLAIAVYDFPDLHKSRGFKLPASGVQNFHVFTLALGGKAIVLP